MAEPERPSLPEGFARGGARGRLWSLPVSTDSREPVHPLGVVQACAGHASLASSQGGLSPRP